MFLTEVRKFESGHPSGSPINAALFAMACTVAIVPPIIWISTHEPSKIHSILVLTGVSHVLIHVEDILRNCLSILLNLGVLLCFGLLAG